jgi:DNA processing protein
MHVDARVEAWASLQLVPGLNADGLFRLLKALGSPVDVRSASQATLARCVPAPVAAAIRRGPDPFSSTARSPGSPPQGMR